MTRRISLLSVRILPVRIKRTGCLCAACPSAHAGSNSARHRLPVLFSSAAVLSAVRCILTCICSIFSTICRSVCGFILSLTLGFILRLVPCFSGTRLVRIIIVSRIILCHASLLPFRDLLLFCNLHGYYLYFSGLLCIIFIKFQPSYESDASPARTMLYSFFSVSVQKTK